MTEPTAGPDLEPLRSAVTGAVLTAGDEGWDAARTAWNLVADQHPTVVVQAAGPDDVVATVRFATENGLRVAPQGTGHAATVYADLDATILLRTDRMKGIEVDADARRARVEAGVLSLELAEAAGEHGLAAVLGSSVDVGVVGFTIGGGLGWLGRRHGLACNSVVSVDLVTAQGELVHADAQTEPELFWAVRGGGGAFGVVTALELELLPLTEVFAGDVMFDAEHAPEVFRRYRDWAASAPAEVTSSVRLLTPPPIPDVPEFMRGRPLVTVTAAYSGPAAEGEELLRPLREAAPSLVDSYATIPAAALCGIHGDPEQPVPGLTGGVMLSELPDEAIDAVLETAAGSSLLQVDFRHLGGALADSDPDGGALAALPGAYAVSAVGAVMGPVTVETVEADLEKVIKALEPRDTVHLLQLQRPPQRRVLVVRGRGVRRLRSAKAQADPERVIRGAQDIQPAG